MADRAELERFDVLDACVRDGRGAPREVRRWWAGAVDAVRAGEAKSLDIALGIRGAGRPPLAVLEQKRAAVARLKRAAGILAAAGGESGQALAGCLAAEIQRVDGRVLARYRNGRPLHLFAPLDQLIIEALDAYDRIPRTARRLARLLNLHADAAK